MTDYESKRDAAANKFGEDYIQYGLFENAFKAGADWMRDEYENVCKLANDYEEQCQVLKAKLEIAKAALEDLLRQSYGNTHAWAGMWSKCECGRSWAFGGNWNECQPTDSCSMCKATKALAQLAPECICGAINARHCPVHG